MTGLDRVSTKSDWLGSEMTRADWADRDAHCLAEDAAAMNRNNRTVTAEQAEELWRAVDELMALLGRIEN